ncbi:Hypothetical protein NTJ_01886 [Nesidiocoris tenuis]|uniref:Uncharacterized protein n=1 Tax=Nesidiocoris tenuis TaxID=355587 RepID=A0ABN7AAP7_9HEMI|nr:Hypothetical protein NTJ_01886 [Nesidiocoris tenuis]
MKVTPELPLNPRKRKVGGKGYATIEKECSNGIVVRLKAMTKVKVPEEEKLKCRLRSARDRLLTSIECIKTRWQSGSHGIHLGGLSGRDARFWGSSFSHLSSCWVCSGDKTGGGVVLERIGWQELAEDTQNSAFCPGVGRDNGISPEGTGEKQIYSSKIHGNGQF